LKQEPILVVMAAGMGSRFGGLKQIASVDEEGHIIIDFSLFDAYQAGFRKVVFIIKEEIAKEFDECIGNRMKKYFDVQYAFQSISDLPDGFSVPEGRTKPWGTGHAIISARKAVDGPFAVINADDYYGPNAFQSIYDFLSNSENDDDYAMVGYRLRNTVTEHGSVARGVCDVEDGLLKNITERTKIFKDGNDARFTEDGEYYLPLSGDTIVSMNLWGFSAKLMNELQRRFPAFLKENLPANPLKCEYFLPTVVNQQLEEASVRVTVLPCEDTWYGVTYKEDLASVKEAICTLKKQGICTKELWK